MFKKILVGVDGSEHGLRAAKIAGEMARKMGSELYLVAAYDVLPTDFGETYLEEILAKRMSQAENIIAAALRECGKIEGTITKEIMEGPPAEAILSVADTRGVDLIIMGTRGLGRIASLIMGSQSLKVVSQAQCPVLLVR